MRMDANLRWDLQALRLAIKITFEFLFPCTIRKTITIGVLREVSRVSFPLSFLSLFLSLSFSRSICFLSPPYDTIQLSTEIQLVRSLGLKQTFIFKKIDQKRENRREKERGKRERESEERKILSFFKKPN